MGAHYDLAVIGAGPAGEKAAVKAAYFGKTVIVIDREGPLGGTCYRGGLPSKVLREAAVYYSGARRHLPGLLGSAPGADLPMKTLLRGVDAVCDAHGERVGRNLARHGVELVHGTAAFEDPHRLVVTPGGRRIEARVILIATGSRPRRPEEIPFDGERVLCSDTVLGMKRIPRRLTVVGAGVIGAEYGSIFAALGAEVNLVERAPRIVEQLDTELSAAIAAAFAARGMRVHLETTMKGCEVGGEGVAITTDRGDTLHSDCLLYTGGRFSNTEALGLDAIGVKVDERGRPEVNEYGQSRQLRHIYAAGDVVGFPALASTSMEQGRVAVGHAFQLDDFRTHQLLPYGIYTIPSVSTVGATEGEVRAKGRPYVVGRARYADRDRGHIIGDVGGMLKLIFSRETRRLLGVHIVGEGAEELIHVGQTCMHFAGTLEYFLKAVVNFPTLSELYKQAAYDALSQLSPGHRTDLEE